ncbi:tyrosine-type recombinase/integrase (plasmid) [Photobacterium damselae subsp. damselae]|uniref:tyrosine-type recombinase/integrase n=1 Tax=Photobacterium damselae TaxID=38293 RepID=UPI001EED792E|nr:tyrosine-type recombinase/integrase [Photobacterium damselae]UKA12846.1 tyrosine-type recombinase/integrase [Photobacterium damselae subsp. damselae]
MAGARAYPISNMNEVRDILRLVDAKNPIIRLLFEFEIRTGLRYVDASKVKWSDVKINGVWRQSFTVVQSKSFNKRMTCGQREANARRDSSLTIHMNSELIALLEDLESFTGKYQLLFQSTHHLAKPNRPITIQYVNRVLKQIAVQLALPYQLSTHSMRKTFALILLEKKAGIHDLRELLGQSSLTATDHYVGTFLDTNKSFTDQISFTI